MARPRACLLVACVILWAALVSAHQDPAAPRTLSRVDRLEAWLTAVEQHRSGTADGWVLGVRDWDATALQLVWVDLWTIVTMIREPKIGVYYPPMAQPRAGQPVNAVRPVSRRIIYSGSELTRLKAIAKDVAARGGENRVLIRGAMLHADIGILAPFRQRPPRELRPAGPSQVILQFQDGQAAGLEESSHFEMGRRLLDFLWPQGLARGKPDPASESTARSWYLAIGSYLQAIGVMDFRHTAQSLRLFPRDADVLFLAGCVHEMASGPQFQTVLQSGDVPKAIASSAQSEGEALGEAERLFRQSLDRDPLQVETRIRLGRVIGRRGRHEEATRELRQAIAATENGLLQYYGHMFLGAEAEALGRTAEAQEAYEQAAALYPNAQTPRLALSALSARRGDRAEALRVVATVLRRREVEAEDDPWWGYYKAQGRATDVLLGQLHARVAEAGRK